MCFVAGVCIEFEDCRPGCDAVYCGRYVNALEERASSIYSSAIEMEAAH